jgi:FAD-linked sulfhydryl oxidase
MEIEKEKPTVWGPEAWEKFHKRALEYCDDPCECEKNCVTHFYYVTFLQYIICESCTADYQKLIRKYPIQECSRSALFQWTVQIHNLINRKLRKPEYTCQQAYNYWSNYQEPDNFYYFTFRRYGR